MPRRIASSLSSSPDSIRSIAAMIIPGVQKPHWRPWCSRNASWTAWSDAVGGDALDRRDLAPVGLHGEDGARLDRGAVDVHDARAALRRVAADVGAGEAEVLAQEVSEEPARLDLRLPADAVDGDRNAVMRPPLSDGRRNEAGGVALEAMPAVSAAEPVDDAVVDGRLGRVAEHDRHPADRVDGLGHGGRLGRGARDAATRRARRGSRRRSPAGSTGRGRGRRGCARGPAPPRRGRGARSSSSTVAARRALATRPT